MNNLQSMTANGAVVMNYHHHDHDAATVGGDDDSMAPGAFSIAREDQLIVERRVAPLPKGHELTSHSSGLYLSTAEFVVESTDESAGGEDYDFENAEVSVRTIDPSDNSERRRSRTPATARQRKPIFSFKCNRTVITIILSVSAVVLVAVAATAGAVIAKNQGTWNRHDESPAPTLAPLLSPERLESLIALRSPATTLEDPDSPQSQAFQWLVIDPYIQSSSLSIDELLQRFALATLFFATGGHRWFNNELWMEGGHECEWAMIICDEETQTKVLQVNLLQNRLVGVLPLEIHLLKDLEVLDLENNDLYDPNVMIPSEVATMERLRVLRLRDNGLEGTIPSIISQLTKLEELDLERNTFTGSIPDIGKLTELQVLNLKANLLNGSIPNGLFELSELRELMLTFNRLTGTLSPRFSKLTSLTHLDVNSNFMQGGIPTTIGSLAELAFLDMGSNRLTGTIPTEMSQLTKITSLLFHTNQLHGTLPEGFHQLTQLQRFHCEFNNDITGTIPSLHNWTEITQLSLFQTNVSGTIPSSLCQVGTTRPRVDCDKIVCDCCQEGETKVNCTST